MKKLQNIFFSLLIFSLAFLGQWAFSSPNIAYAQTIPSTTLKVALFPYIPDSAQDQYQALLTRIESEFETQNPSIDLVLKPLNPDEEGFYNLDTLKQWLSNSTNEQNGYHLVEIDTLLLGDLVKANVAKAWNNPENTKDWYPAGLNAVTINGNIYGIPHLLCGHFIFSRNDQVVKTKSVDKILTILQSITPDIPNLAGDLTGSWNLPALYLDAWADTYGTKEIDSALSPNLDKLVIKSFKKFANNCQVGDANPCFDKYGDVDSGAEAFINNQVDAFFGYSERLSYIFKNGINPDVKLASLPLSEGSNPVLFVDALVLRQDCNQTCQNAANKFAAYLDNPNTQEWILSSKDAGVNGIPRYLIPATYSAFKTDSLHKDSYYKTLEKVIKNAVPYPNSGFPEVRKTLKQLILKELQQG
ncbi:MAG: extracellular solute-binding protein [Aphanizomenon gracile PMC638.10]|nr:extracellular solute-binding protein [Aphanizomenon gracile PMC638.10]